MSRFAPADGSTSSSPKVATAHWSRAPGFLKCRVARQAGEASEARACLERFRAAHPGSARDEEALAALVRLAEEQGACNEMRLLVAEHQRLYPGVVLPEGNRARCPP